MNRRARRGVALVALAGALLGTAVAAGPASAEPAPVYGKQLVRPLAGEGLMAMTRRACGTSATWKYQARINNLSAPYTLYRSRRYLIICTPPRVVTVPPVG